MRFALWATLWAFYRVVGMNFQPARVQSKIQGFFHFDSLCSLSVRMTRQSKDNSRSPSGMTTRNAKAKARTTADPSGMTTKKQSKRKLTLSLFQCLQLVEGAGPVCAEEAGQAS